MPLNRNRPSVVSIAAIPLVLVAAISFPASRTRAQSRQDNAAVAATFRAKCAMCHGPDGAGSEVGKSMNVPDLRSQAVQKLPDSELVQVISDGKAGMPPFKSSLSDAQIHALVKYIRSLRPKK